MILPIAYIVIYEDGKFLLTSRKVDHEDDPTFDGKWQLPGGGLEIGEHIKETVRREAREELGIDVDLKRSLALTEVISHGEDWHGLAMAFLCKRIDISQPIHVNHESYGYGWYTLQEAQKLDLMPFTADILEYVVMSYRLFKVGIVSIIRSEDKYLLMRIHAPHKEKSHDKWSFMMGTCDLYESLESAVIRETKEETGLDVRIVQRLAHVFEVYDLKLFCYIVEPIEPTQPVVLNHEASEWKWFSKDELIHMDPTQFYGDTLPILSILGHKSK